LAPEEDVMAKATRQPDRLVQDHIHPAAFKTMAAFAIMMIAASWVFASDSYATVYPLLIVSAFILGSLGLPVLFRRARRWDTRPWRGSPPPAVTGRSLSDWAADDLRISQGRISGQDAMIQAVLPIAAVGIGMLLFAIVWIATAG